MRKDENGNSEVSEETIEVGPVTIPVRRAETEETRQWAEATKRAQLLEDQALFNAALSDAHPGARCEALLRLRARCSGDPRTLSTLVAALKEDPDPRVRDAAAMELGNLGNPSAVQALTDALDDADEDVRWSARFSLDNLMTS